MESSGGVIQALGMGDCAVAPPPPLPSPLSPAARAAPAAAAAAAAHLIRSRIPSNLITGGMEGLCSLYLLN